MTERFSKVVDLPSAPEWGAVWDGVEGRRLDAGHSGWAHRAAGRALPIKAYDRLAGDAWA